MIYLSQLVGNQHVLRSISCDCCGRDTIVVGTNKRVVIILKVDSDPKLFVVGKKGDLIHNLFVDIDAIINCDNEKW